jgi:hypothetical protein
LGELPQIDPKALNFLHKDIKQACVCIGTFVDGKIQAQWLGKNALTKVDRKAIEIDARVCAEVSDIFRRLLAEEFS